MNDVTRKYDLEMQLARRDQRIDELEIYRQKLQLSCKILRDKVNRLEKENEDLENKILFAGR